MAKSSRRQWSVVACRNQWWAEIAGKDWFWRRRDGSRQHSPADDLLTHIHILKPTAQHIFDEWLLCSLCTRKFMWLRQNWSQQIHVKIKIIIICNLPNLQKDFDSDTQRFRTSVFDLYENPVKIIFSSQEYSDAS